MIYYVQWPKAIKQMDDLGYFFGYVAIGEVWLGVAIVIE